jgi:hypothetical protein
MTIDVTTFPEKIERAKHGIRITPQEFLPAAIGAH